MNIRELRDKRMQAITSMRQLVETAEGEERTLNAEEKEQFQRLRDEVRQLDERIQAIETTDNLLEEARRSGAIRPAPEIGMSRNEVRRYSLIRAIRAAATGDWRGAELEREASEATAQKLGREPRSFFVPYDWMAAETRDLVVGTASAGGHLVATDLLVQNFIELLRNRMVTDQAGATVLTGLVGNVAIPRQTGGATAYWVAESGSPTESQQAFDQVTLSPKTVGAFTDISRKLLLQTSMDVERFVRNDLATVLALAIDYAALNGSGTGNQPLGIANVTGIGSVVGGANGAAPTWTHIVRLETEVAMDNADVGRLAYVTSPKVRGKLKTTEKASGTAQFIWENGNTPLNGYRALVSNQVRDNITKGTGSNLSQIFFGNWGDLIIGQWGALDILVDPYTGSTSGTVRVVALQDVDIAVRHAESFALMADADAN
jgi:HK97 family phage major capsid protein